MNGTAFLLFIAMLIAAIFAFSGPWEGYSEYAEPVSVTPYEFASYIFWILMLLFFFAVIVAAISAKPPKFKTAEEIETEEAQKTTISGGFILAISFVIISVVSGVFGFGVVASTFAALAMIIFWMFIILAIIAIFMEAFSSGRRR